MDFSILNFQIFKILEIGPKISPNRPKITPKPSQICPKIFDFPDFFHFFVDPWGQPWGPLEAEGRPWAHNGPFELSVGHREHRERVRSLNLMQFEPPKIFPGFKNVKIVLKKLRDAVS